MDSKSFDEIMHDLPKPNVQVDGHQKVFRMALLNTKKSVWAGILLMILPFFFLLGVFLNHYLSIDFPLLTGVYSWITALDQQYGDESILNWVVRIMLLFGPPLAAGLNLLAVLHIRYEAEPKELILSFKLRWRNWVIIFICTGIFLLFFMYLILEN